MLISDDQIKRLVLASGLIDEKRLDEVSSFAKSTGIALADAFVEKDIITDENLGLLIANELRLPFIVVSRLTIPDEVLTLVPEKVARKQKVLAFQRDQDGIKLAMADPTKREIVEAIAKKTNERIVPYYATERDIVGTLHSYRKELQRTIDELMREAVGEAGTAVSAEAPIAKIVDVLVDYAYQDKASDIHIEPEEKNSLIRFRIDGILHDVLYLPKILHDRIVTRIKVLSRLRTDEHLSAQDGKMRLVLDEETLDVRVSIIPITDGEKVVLRLLSSRSRQFSLIDLGMNEKDLQKVTNAFNKAYGMILSTGPTGCGKTTSIYAILKILNTREKNITTIEDPVEYKIKGVNQIQVNPKTNLTFASGLRSVLRQDPNVIFVGEVRDGETAGIAVNAALTGHLVLSTLHTNDSATALPRLIDMKVEPFLVGSTVNLIIAQRLVRKICSLCKQELLIERFDLVKHLPKEIIDRNFGTDTSIRTYRGVGCKTCHTTGYMGRIGIFEVLEMNKELRKLIAEKKDSDVISQEAVLEGMTTMLDDGLQKVKLGLTTIEEVLRVTKVESV